MATKSTPKVKKLTKKEQALAAGLMSFYNQEGDLFTFVGDDKKTRITDPMINTVLAPQAKAIFEKCKEDTRKLAKKLNINCEVKVIIKLI